MLIARGMPEPKEVDFEYDGSSPRAAARIFCRRYGFWPETVANQGAEIPWEWTVIGGCECCGEAILDGDKYSSSEDGVYLCSSCGEALREEK